MKYSSLELLDYVIRYMAENSITLDDVQQVEYAIFSGWLLQQNFCKPDVMRWQDFKEQKPIDGQNVLILNLKTGQAIVSEWQSKYEFLMKEDDRWIPAPDFA